MSPSVRVKALPLALQRLVQDPIGLSAIASLALHLPLLLFLPRLFSNTPGLEEPDLPSSINVVELTPAEQQRVPNFQTPEIILPPLAQTPSSLSITPLPKASLPSSPSTLPPLPSLNAPSGSLWGFGSSFPAFPPVGNTEPPIFTAPRTQTPIIPPLPPRVPTQPPSQPPTPTPPTAQPSVPNPLPTTIPDGESAPLPTQPPNTAANPSPTPRSDEQIAQDLLAGIQARQQSLTFNEAGTTESSANSALQKWLADFGQPWLGVDQATVLGATRKLNINGSYPVAARDRNLKGDVIVAVLVDEQGKPASETAVTLLRSSGYGIFDQAALQDALAYSFEPTGKKATYFLNVIYAPKPVT